MSKEKYYGSLREVGEKIPYRMRYKDMGDLMISKDKIDFYFRDGKLITIQKHSIEDIELYGKWNRIIITLKNKTKYIFCLFGELKHFKGWETVPKGNLNIYVILEEMLKFRETQTD